MAQVNIIKPIPALAKYVNYFWAFDADDLEDGKIQYRIVADGLPGLIFQHFEGKSIIEQAGGAKLPTTFAYGQATAPFTNFSKKQSSITGVSLKPNSLPVLFKTHAYEFTNKLFPLNELSASDINDQLLNTANQKSRVNIISNYLLQAMRTQKQFDSIIEDSLDKMIKGSPETTIRSLLKEYHISERHFERKFKMAVGIRPQQYLRILRFQQAIRQVIASVSDRLSSVAYDLNYADQSHFIRDFKEFSGFTPKEFLNRNAGDAPSTAAGITTLRVIQYT